LKFSPLIAIVVHYANGQRTQNGFRLSILRMTKKTKQTAYFSPGAHAFRTRKDAANFHNFGNKVPLVGPVEYDVI
jgi:hypothetical protein